jgi:hypothetical protein
MKRSDWKRHVYNLNCYLITAKPMNSSEFIWNSNRFTLMFEAFNSDDIRPIFVSLPQALSHSLYYLSSTIQRRHGYEHCAMTEIDSTTNE